MGESMKKIKRAIISVSDKSGLVELATTLQKHNVEIFSTGGTLKTLHEANIEARSIESYTEFPEMLDGRVKTLHPKIHGGILARRELKSHMESLDAHNILEFDLVCINLYPFETVIQKNDFSFEEAIENIDIGGPSMIRAAAKNYEDVAIVTSADQYPDLISRLDELDGALSREYRFSLAVAAFNRTGSYDSIISEYLNHLQGDYRPSTLNLTLARKQELRYGENPHQQGSFYSFALDNDLPWKNLHGKELSFNNLLDLDAALKIAIEYDEPTCVIFKHTNPCGIASGRSQSENLQLAMKTDPISYFGGIVSFNDEVTKETAEILNKEFFEIICAPGFTKEAFDILAQKKNIRLVEVPNLKSLKVPSIDIRSSSFGFLVQEADREIIGSDQVKVVTKVQPKPEDLEELLFAFKLVKHIKSNAIAFTNNKHSIGIGAGQMSRIDSVNIAIEKAARFGLDIKGTVMASDAFFPFRDTVDSAVKAGVRGIIQPGGSIKDEESIKAADEAGIFMVFTGMRHFRH